MSTLSRVRALLSRLPLGENRQDPPGSAIDDVKRRLARTLEPDEAIRWSGWVYAGRSIPPDQSLLDAACAVTDRRIVWVPTAEPSVPDFEILDNLLPLRLDKRTKRLLLRTIDRDEAHPDLAVIWSFDLESLIDVLAESIQSEP